MNRKLHWAARARWARDWRRKTHLVWLAAGRPVWRGPARVVITAHVARLMDTGALGPTVKPVEDEALFLMLGGIERVQKDGRVQRIAPDGPLDGHDIHHEQAVRRDHRGVLITISHAQGDRHG